MARRFELEPGTDQVAGDKEQALFSLAVSMRRIADLGERVVGLAEAFHGSLSTLTGPDGHKKVAAYVQRLRTEFDTDSIDPPKS